MITDAMVERAAFALERSRKAPMEWTDEQFDIWFNRDAFFVSRITVHGDNFRGTRKEHLFHEVRLVLEAALNPSGA